MKNLLESLTKSVFIPLGLTEAASVKNAAIQKNIFVSGSTTLILSNLEMNDIMKMIKSFEGAGLFLWHVSETIK